MTAKLRGKNVAHMGVSVRDDVKLCGHNCIPYTFHRLWYE